MAMRRPRIKVAANLSIRRPTKAAASGGDSKPVDIPAPPVAAAVPSDRDEGQERHVVKPEAGEKIPVETTETDRKPTGLNPVSTPSPVAEQSAFKFPKPVEEPPRLTTPAPVPHSPLEVNTDEPHSPKKLDSKFAYINALNSPRKRIRTESMTSNKSYSDVSLKSRKTIKQEESQKASDAKRDLRKRLNNIQNIDKQSLTMFDMIYYNPVKNPMKSPALSKKGSLENIPRTVDRESRSVSKSRSPTPAPAPMMPPPPEVPSVAPTTQPTPQIKLGPNGEMILDETSLVIENEREKALRESMAKAEIVYVDEFSGNSGYYSRYKRTRDWPPEETIRFYRCLHTIGTDFSMMIQLFPNRSRRDLKLKFKKEERLNLKLVNKALLFPKEFNIEELRQQFQEEDEEIERLKEQERQEKAELDEKIKQQKMAKKMQLNQSKSRNPKKRVSKSTRAMLNIDQLASAESLVKEVKPKRKAKRKVAQKNAPQQEAAVSGRRKASKVDFPEPVDVEDDVFDDAVGGSNDDESNREDRLPQVDSVPYIPNGGFEQHETDPGNSEPSRSPLENATPSNESPVNALSSECQLDINAMDIDIVDAQSRNVYEIKAEPKVYPVQIYESNNNGSLESQSVITLQNLDDQSQTTVTYCKPAAMVDSDQRLIGSEQDVGIDSIESKYYGGCNVMYMPTPTNAPIAHPVKTETSFYPVQPTFVPTREPSPPLVYDLHPASEPSTEAPSPVPATSPVKPDVQEATTSEESNSVSTDPSPTPLEPKSEREPVEPSLEDSNSGVQESESSEDQQPPTEVSEEAGEEEADEEPRGLGPLEDIDINSLVLVESQDTTNPGKTIYEIFVIDPETGKLSEKPLDVPEDVIENIRSILEVGED